MKKMIILTTTVAVLAGISVFSLAAQGQNPTPAAKSTPHMVGLIDMAYIFKKYKKFEVLREDLKAEIAQTDQKARAMAEQMKSLQGQLKSFKDDNPDYLKREKEIVRLKAELESFANVSRREFMRKDSQIYKTVYLEVTDVVKQYCEAFHYTLIIRFNREDLEKAGNPQEVIRTLNRQVVYYQPDDDITLSVLTYLNDQYNASANRASSSKRTQQK